MLAGEEARINCLVEANPENLTSVEWFRDGTLVEEERMNFEGSWGTTLVIAEVEPEDAGSYSCKAGNEVGEASSESFHLLEVHCKYVSRETQCLRLPNLNGSALQCMCFLAGVQRRVCPGDDLSPVCFQGLLPALIGETLSTNM